MATKPKIITRALQLLVGDDIDPTDWRSLVGVKKRELKPLSKRELLSLESEIGATIFGEIPKDRRREFFCLDEKNWVWHEEWTDEKKNIYSNTIRYEIDEKGVLKIQPGPRYSYLEGEELQNFGLAIRIYYERVSREVYKRNPATGKKMV